MAESKPQLPQNPTSQWWPLFLLAFALYYVIQVVLPTPPKTLAYSEFLTQVEQGEIARVVIKGEQIRGYYQGANDAAKRGFDFQLVVPEMAGEGLLAQLLANDITVSTEASAAPVWAQLLMGFLPWLLIIGFFVWSSRALQKRLGGGAGIAGFSQSRARRFKPKDHGPSYDDIAGQEPAKQDLQEIIEFLKRPDKYHAMGAHVPKGVLLMGAPGTGKTLLAKATANEAGVPFYSVSGSEFIEMFVGVGASRVRDMFAQARKEAPAVIFIDEIDSVGRARGTGLGGGNDEREQTLNQILAEMDGFEPEEAVVVLAATNRPDVLDPALLRPGRFDRKVTLDLPQRDARLAILRVHCRAKHLAADVQLEELAALTPGFSGAELANLVNEAALAAVRGARSGIEQSDFLEARDKVVMGSPRTDLLNPGERKRIAAHESGHALTAHFAKHSDPVEKITIVPRGRALGLTEQLPEEDRHNLSQTYLQERLAILMGGRVAERLLFGDVSTGAADDLQQATQLAYKMVGQWGMGEGLAPVGYRIAQEHPFLGREITEPKEYSEYMARTLDTAAQALLKDAEAQAETLLRQHRQQLEALVADLLQKETVHHQALVELLDSVTEPLKTD